LHPEEGLGYPKGKGYSLPNRFFHGAGQESFQGKSLEPKWTRLDLLRYVAF
jgi:hypothetical protein